MRGSSPSRPPVSPSVSRALPVSPGVGAAAGTGEGGGAALPANTSTSASTYHTRHLQQPPPPLHSYRDYRSPSLSGAAGGEAYTPRFAHASLLTSGSAGSAGGGTGPHRHQPMLEARLNVLEQELENRRAQVRRLEEENVQRLKEVAQTRIDEENRRAALAAQHQRDLEKERERVALILRDQDSEVRRRVASEIDSSAESGKRALLLEGVNAQSQAILTQKEKEIRELRQQLRDARDAENAKGSVSRVHEGRIEALQAMVEARGREVQQEADRANAAAARADAQKLVISELRQRVDELEEEDGKKSVLVESLRGDVAAVQARFNEAKAEAGALKQQASSAASSAKDVEHQYEAKMGALREELRARTKQLGEQELRTAQLQDALADAQEEATKLRESCAAAQRKQQQLQDANKSARLALDEAEAKAAQDAVAIQSAQQQLERVKAAHEASKRRLEERDQELMECEERCRELEHAAHRASLHEETIRTQRSQIERLSADVELEVSKHAETRKAHEQAEGRVRELSFVHKQLQALEATVKSREQENSGLQESLTTRVAQVEEAHHQLASHEHHIAQLDKQILLLRTECDKLNEANSALEDSCSRLPAVEGRCKQLEGALDARQEDIAALSKALDAARGDVEAAQRELEQVPQLSAALQKACSDRESAEAALATATAELRRAEGMAKDAAAAVKKRDAELENAAVRGRELETRVEVLEEMVRMTGSLKDEIATLETKLRHSETAAEGQRLALENARVEISALQQRLAMAEEDLEERDHKAQLAHETIEGLQVEIGRRDVFCDAAAKQAEKAKMELQVAEDRARAGEEQARGLGAQLEAAQRGVASAESDLQRISGELAVASRTNTEAQEQIATLRGMLARASEERDAAEAAVERLQANAGRCATLEGKVHALEEVVRTKEGREAELEGQLKQQAELLREQQALVVASERTEARCAELRQTTQQQQEQLDELERAKAELTRNLSLTRKELQVSLNDNARLRELLEGEEERCARLTSEAGELEAALRRKAGVEGHAEGLQAVVETQSVEIAKLSRETEQQRTTIREIGAELARVRILEESIEDLQRQLARRTETIAVLEEEQQRRKRQLEALQEDLAVAERKARAGAAEAEDATGVVASLQQKITALQDRADALERGKSTEARKLLMEVNALEAKCDELQETVQQQETALRAAQEASRRSADEHAATKLRLQKAERELGSDSVELDLLRQAVAEHKASTQQLTQALLQEKKHSGKLATDLAAKTELLNTADARHSEVLARRDADAMTLQNTIDELRQELRQRVSALEDVAGELKRAESQRDARAKEVDALQLERESLGAQLSSMRSSLSAMREAQRDSGDARTASELALADAEVVMAQQSSKLALFERRCIDAEQRADALLAELKRHDTTQSVANVEQSRRESQLVAELHDKQGHLSTAMAENRLLRHELAAATGGAPVGAATTPGRATGGGTSARFSTEAAEGGSAYPPSRGGGDHAAATPAAPGLSSPPRSGPFTSFASGSGGGGGSGLHAVSPIPVAQGGLLSGTRRAATVGSTTKSASRTGAVAAAADAGESDELEQLREDLRRREEARRGSHSGRSPAEH